MPKGRHRPDPLDSPTAAKRRCLTCRQDFDSAWAGERICPDCKLSHRFEAATGLPEQYG